MNTPVTHYNKAIVAGIGMLVTILFNLYGERLGLPADWPETMTAVLTPLLVALIPNKPAVDPTEAKVVPVNTPLPPGTPEL